MNYTGKSTRRTHFGIHTGDGLRIEVLAPWNIRNFSSGGFDSNSLYVVRLEEAYQFSRSHLGLGLTYITDGNFKRDLGPYGGELLTRVLPLMRGLYHRNLPALYGSGCSQIIILRLRFRG